MSISFRLLSLAILGHIVHRAGAQLVVPSAVPDVEDNWKLIAAVAGDPQNPLRLSIQNREVGFARTDTCCGFAVLKDPDDHTARTFHLNREEGTIHSQDDAKNLTLYIAPSGKKTSNPEYGQPLQLVHGEGTAGLEIQLTKSGPRVTLQEMGQFYVCKTTIKGNYETQIFFSPDKTYLPHGCVDITLIPKCVKGPARGKDNVAFCCFNVRDGECLSDQDIPDYT